ncbi:phosphonate ABC transporter, permease protein PhnE [Halorubrum sp. JWXQ-INN 858]|uniref:phosphonate ABC transporter, permease protein PhnE n=1 Tax=Halorubrum sp. JWXQ-INN 858 TaxID=2690782 RepID=UPI00135C34B1|nr:phosphonate ABC transporter, permease protein PhnE [Halorubrum sp. JWXQ-INN 858]MWV64081.1 phosphonate ABC transporter, permease protein PhnE [Halorubrum sp. JWXQ-INN 858]
MSGELADSEFASYDGEWERPTVFYNTAVKYLVYAVVLVFLVWNVVNVWVPIDRLLRGFGSAWLLVTSMFPPDFGVSIVVTPVQVGGYNVFVPSALAVDNDALRLWSGMIETLAMSIVATAIGVVISVPIAVMAAENLVPRPVYVVGRAIVSVSRALHELVIGIIVVVGFGFGALAGVIALVFATPGFLAKLLAEDLEDIDPTQMDAIRSTGASPIQVLLYGVAPQVMPRLIGLSIYRWDINIRAATILGVVGAGGIGNVLIRSFDRYDYQYSMAIILSIIAVVIVGEVASAVARRRVQ